MKCWPILLLIFALTGCGSQEMVAVTDRSEVERIARFPVPASAGGLQCRTESGKSRTVCGRFEIPAVDLPKILERMPAEAKVTLDNGRSNVILHKLNEPWWKPEQIRNGQVAEWTEANFSVNLLFGESLQPGISTVYFFNFEK